MFDISFGELMLIGVIALVVIGPQRLPTVARTLGHLIGRAQRYVNDVKHDIQKEIDLEALNKVKSQMESAARSVQSSVQDVGSSLSKPIEETQQALNAASTAVQGSLNLDSIHTDPSKTDATSAAALTDASAQLDANTPSSETHIAAASDVSIQTDNAPSNADDANVTIRPGDAQNANAKPTQEPST